MPQPIAVFDILGRAHKAVFFDPKHFLDAVWPWMGLSLLSIYAFERLAGAEGYSILRLLLIVPHVVSLSAVMSKWSRWIVLGEMPVGRALFAWGRREWRVLGATFGSGLIIAAPMLLFLFLFLAIGADALSLIVLPWLGFQFAGTYFWARFSLAPVAAALDGENLFGHSWRATNKQVPRILAVSVGAALPLLALQLALSYGLATVLGVEESMTPGTPQEGVMIMLGAVTGFLIMAVVQSAQALAFKALMAPQAPSDPQP